MLIQLSYAAFEMLLIIISSGQTLSSAQAGGIAAGVIAFVYIVAQFIGVICYKKGVCKKSTPRPRPSQMRNNRQTPAVTTYPLTSFPTVGSNAMSHTVSATTPQFSLNGTQHPYHGQPEPQHLYQPQPYVHPDASILTLEEPPHLEAATHAGEAPPAYHTAVHYETMTPEAYKSLKLSEGSALYSAKPDSGNTDAPPT